MCFLFVGFNVSLADRTSMAALKMCVDSSIVGVKFGNRAKIFFNVVAECENLLMGYTFQSNYDSNSFQ